ncbi:MAG: nuclear transport factor 2 family protein [Gemmatimonadaceae bacterium]
MIASAARAVLLCVTLAGAVSAQDAEREAVRRAVLDYVDGFYLGDSTLQVRSIRPEVFKYGFGRGQSDTTYRGMQMSWPQFHAFANRVKASGRPTPADAPKEIVLFEVQDQTASAKLTAWWGTDYLLLGKYDGKWMIAHVMWQSPPPAPAK